MNRSDVKQCLTELGVDDTLANCFVKMLFEVRKTIGSNGVSNSNPHLSKLMYLWEEMFKPTEAVPVYVQARQVLEQSTCSELDQALQQQITSLKNRINGDA